jgi:superfamily II DNA or RNA helicase
METTTNEANMINLTTPTIALNHPVKDFLTSQDVDRLLGTDDVIDKINSFCGRLEDLASAKYGTNDDDRNKFKGDLFELLVEFLVKTKGQDNRIAITAYQTGNEAGFVDYGVDGVGKSTINSKMATVQVKYRQQNEVLTWNTGNFGNFGFQSLQLIVKQGGYEHFPVDNTQMLYITTAGGVHYSTEEISSSQIRIIDRNGLRDLCDGVKEFWILFKDSIIASQTKCEVVAAPLALRDHQRCAVNAIIDDMRLDDGHGKIVLPTGTGKTLVQAQAIIEAHKEFGHRCFVILSPRILLSFQHLANVADHLIRCGVDAEFLNVNSGNFDEQIINGERSKAGFAAARIRSTTRSAEITEAFGRAKAQDKLLIISSTYHSAERIREAGIEVDVQLNDEAHNMVSEEFESCHGIGKNCFHFTATERYTDDSINGLGMNNEGRWGNLTFEKLPKDMIDAGEMLPPVLHIVETGQGQVDNNDYNAIFTAIVGSFGVHRDRLKTNSADPAAIGPKLLVTVGGQETLRGLIGESGSVGCIAFEEFRRNNPHVAFFAVSSELGAYVNGIWLDANNRSKDQLLQAVRKLDSADEAVILYVDMLTEGIDVPGITAFMPLRGMNESRFKQGIGRAVRLHGTDRIKFYAGEISPLDATKYVKPDAEIIIPTILVNSRDTAAQYTRLWESMYDTFGHQEHVVLSVLRGIDEESELEDLNEVEHQHRQIDSGVEEFIHSVIGRPDKLDIDEIWLVEAIRQGTDAALVSRLHRKLGARGHLDTYRSIAQWQDMNDVVGVN